MVVLLFWGWRAGGEGEGKGVKKQHWDKGRKTKSSIGGIEKKNEGGMSGKVGRRLKDGKVRGALFGGGGRGKAALGWGGDTKSSSIWMGRYSLLVLEQDKTKASINPLF